MNGFDGDQVIEAVAAAATAEGRFAAVAQGVAFLGIDVVNYGFLDPAAAERAQADILFLTTMSDQWMQYYADYNLAERDTHVLRLKAKNMAPYLWGATAIAQVSRPEQSIAFEAAEAGLRSAICIPLASPLDPFTPVAAINFASSLSEADLTKVISEHGPQLTSVAHILHNASIRQLWRHSFGNRGLTIRERDCLQYLADGCRQVAIAHSMGIARVTVEIHLRSARRKLVARTLSEAVAKALLVGEINRS